MERDDIRENMMVVSVRRIGTIAPETIGVVIKMQFDVASVAFLLSGGITSSPVQCFPDDLRPTK